MSWFVLRPAFLLTVFLLYNSPSLQLIHINLSCFYPHHKVWEKISGMAAGLAFGENIIWAWNRTGHVFYRVVQKDKPEGKKWIKLSDDEKMMSISAGSGVCYATDREGIFHRRNGITASTPEGTDWQAVEEFYFAHLSAGAAHSIGLERTCAIDMQEEMIASSQNKVGIQCNWLTNSTSGGNQYSITSSFCVSQVLYTWQMARRVVCLKRVPSSSSLENMNNEGSKLDDEDDLSSRLSPKAMSALLGDEMNENNGNCVRVAGLGPLLCDGEKNDPSCHFYCEFASNAMDWRGYLDTSVIYLRSVKTGKYLHIDEHTNLPHCNRTSGGNPCMMTVNSNFDVGNVSLHFKNHDNASLSFSENGDPVRVKSTKRRSHSNVEGVEDSIGSSDDEVSHKLDDDDGDGGGDNSTTKHSPSFYVVSIVDDGNEFRNEFMKSSADNSELYVL